MRAFDVVLPMLLLALGLGLDGCRAEESTFNVSEWRAAGFLQNALSSATVMFYNETFAVFGGCLTADCSSLSDDVLVYDPVAQLSVTSTFPALGTGGFAGPSAVALYNDAFYLVRSCSFYFGASGASPEVVKQYGAVSEIDESSVNSSFYQIPDPFVRGNASCVGVREKLFIIGGFNLTSLEPTRAVDMLDISAGEYFANYTFLDVALENPAVATDGVMIFVGGGELHNPRKASSAVFALHITSPDTSKQCVWRTELPDPQLMTGDDGTELSLAVYGSILLAANQNKTVFASLDLRTSVAPAWKILDTRSRPGSLRSAQRRSCWGFVPLLIGNSSVLTLYQLGGTDDGQVIANVSKAVTTVVLPSPLLPSTVVVDGKFIFALQGANESVFCSGASSNCVVRLSDEPSCSGDAAGTEPVQYVYPHRVAFVVVGKSSPVYVCFSFGVSSAACPLAPFPYFPINLQNPLSIISQGTNAPSPPSKSSGTNMSLLLYILGGVAAITTGVAVLLVAKLRKVPDEGLLSGAASSPATYGIAHQEERYRIISKIGEGTFSVVYLVHRRADGAKFALKHMECQSDLQRHEAIKECEIVRSLQGHPNVINLVDMFMNYEFDSARNDDAKTAAENLNNNLLEHDTAGNKRSRHLCLVMQYHPAGDLRKWTLSQPTTSSIPEAILLSVAFQVCSVLKHCHAQDPPVIHRDLKPENILISNPSHHASLLPIVVTDFGLARVQEGTHCASGAGTVPYVAPECFKKKYTVQCDIWSLGCVLYAVATRRVNNNTVRLMFQDVGNPDFHSSIRRDLSKLNYSDLFISFVLMLLEPEPKARPTATQAFRLFRKKKDEIVLSAKAMEVLKSGADSVIPTPEERERHIPLPRNADSIEFTPDKDPATGPASLNNDALEAAVVEVRGGGGGGGVEAAVN